MIKGPHDDECNRHSHNQAQYHSHASQGNDNFTLRAVGANNSLIFLSTYSLTLLQDLHCH